MSYRGNYKKRDEKYLMEKVLSMIPDEHCGTSSKDIANVTGISSRDVRYIVQKLRDEGYPICATPAYGYWMARYSSEMNDTILKLQAHIDSCEDTLHSLKIAQNSLEDKEKSL